MFIYFSQAYFKFSSLIEEINKNKIFKYIWIKVLKTNQTC